MHIVKLFEDWKALNEIGNASHRPYTWKRKIGYDDEGIELLDYTFSTDKGTKYIAFFSKEGRGVYEFSFTIKGKQLDTVSNEGELFQVMSTIVDIMKDGIRQIGKFEYIYFSGSKNFNGDNRRNKLYRAYLEKNLPNGFRVSYFKGEVHIKPK